MKKTFSLICAVLFGCAVAGTSNAGYFKSEWGINLNLGGLSKDGAAPFKSAYNMTLEFGPGGMDFFRAMHDSYSFGRTDGKAMECFVFPYDHNMCDMKGLRKYSSSINIWTQYDILKRYKGYIDFGCLKRGIIKRDQCGHKKIFIRHKGCLPRKFRCKPDTVVPIGSSAILLGSGILGILLLGARRLKFRD